MNRMGAYLTLHGKAYDVDSEYLYDPKISTFVKIPAGGELTVISPEFVKRIYIVSDVPVNIRYGDEELLPFQSKEISPDILLSVFKLTGDDFKFSIFSPDNQDAKILFITSVSMDISRIFYTNTNKVIMPHEVSFDVIVNTGVPAGVSFFSIVEPDDGYVFDVKYFKVATPAHAVANIIIDTPTGKQVLLANNQDANTYRVYDASDFENGALSQVYTIIGFVQTTDLIFGPERIKFSFGGLQEVM